MFSFWLNALLSQTSRQFSSKLGGNQVGLLGVIMLTLVGLFLTFVHVAFAGMYFYLTWYHKYWKKRGVVTAEPLTILGTYPGILVNKSRSLILDVQEVYK